MSERLLGSRDDATAVHGGGGHPPEPASCALRWWVDDAQPLPYGVEAAGPWGAARAYGRSLFDALRDVRRELEAADWLLAVNGSRPDVHQSGMLSSSGSDLAYELRPGMPVDPGALVNLFADASVDAVTSVDEQAAAYTRWLESL
ncbi:hypothetical protein ABZ611_16725 [Streptomyces sp. NPDC007861]|uniref:hypothetical protein n=1 Tax=Streptomyces sp. NPDC007861 TaxID=3154893 RepID=UPI0033F56D01